MAACRTFLNWRARAAGRPNQSRALVSLRLLVAGKLDGLAVAADGRHRVVAPFPLPFATARHIDAPPGVKYQVLIDGTDRGRDIAGPGRHPAGASGR